MYLVRSGDVIWDCRLRGRGRLKAKRQRLSAWYREYLRVMRETVSKNRRRPG